MDAVNFLNVEYVYLRIVDLFRGFDLVAILNAIIHFLELLRPIALILAVVLVWAIVHARTRLKKLEEEEDAKFHSVRKGEAETEPGADPVLNEKWQKVQAHINSTSPSDWRLAILEADIMLGEILEKMGYQGDSIGERLKGVERSDFLTLDKAWEAHKVRNQIAHEGTDFQLSDREARRVIELYKEVFSEFYYI